MAAASASSGNPLLAEWNAPFGTPPFEAIRPDDFGPAFEAGLAESRAGLAAIAEQAEEPSFANTIEALEGNGPILRRVASVFFNLAGADTSDAIEAIEREMAPVLARLSNEMFLNGRLFDRIAALHARRDELDLTPEQARVLERYHTMFVRNGAALPESDKTRLAEINERLASLSTAFGQNVLADERAWILQLTADDLDGLSEAQIAAAAKAAQDRGVEGYAITLARSSIEPFLQSSRRRDLRETAFRAWIARGENAGATDNRPIIAEMVKLRAEYARLLGYESFAHFRLADVMAKTPDAVRGLLDSVWTPAKARAEAEQRDLQKLAATRGDNIDIEAWDWRFYTEAVRKERFDLDDAEIKPYLQLDNIIAAAFDTATQLFGVTFQERHDVPVYHPDVRAWEVLDAEGGHVGLFLGDYFARASKHSGAWMSSFRDQERLAGEVRPIIVNVMNFSKPPEGQPALLGMDDARTLFHEFGHGLHGLLSDVTYPLISGTSVARDFVELPSQLYEHWLEQKEVLSRFAVHHETGAPMPDEMLERLLAARRFNQGFATVEYTSSALLDLDIHLLPDAAGLDASAFEREALERIGMPAAIVMRHRTPHFGHIFSGGYSAGYYSYLWSEVLDADAFDAFREAGDIFDPVVARRLKDFIYSAGGRQDPHEAYRAFRGRDASPEALLKKRGLDIADLQTGEV
ncbi:M3 family metallopeptidase [Terrihabitans sp. B22-R8]|uniref:M3 family metallopeptidase n=1 Tax=Terrihabitans sp. B22-R8 TaxID=3425128 RepID=UPI00403D230E